MGKKLTQEFVEALLSKEGYSILEPYKSSVTPILIKCPIGHQYRATIGNYCSRNSRCPICNNEQTSKNSRTPFEKLLELAKEKGATLLFNKEFYEQNHHKKLKIKVLCKCGIKETNISVGSFKKWTGCHSCSVKNVLAKRPEKLIEIKELVENKGYKLISTEYHGQTGPLILMCEKHGEWETRWGDLKNDHWCKRCAASAVAITQRVNIETIKKTLEKIGYTLISTEYTGNKNPLMVLCPKHGEFKTRWNQIDQGQKCPKCTKNYSKPHEEMVNFVKSIYSGTIIINDRTILHTEGERKTKALELDIWLPELKIGIEHDGLRWHSKRIKDNPDKENLIKLKKIKEKNIVFLAFFEDEWANKRSIVESIIKNKMGLITRKIHARKTEFIEITNKEAKEFLINNHIDGHVKCNKAFGLKHEGELVMCMTFRKTFRGEHELARMATLIDHVVVGGASKMLKNAPKPLVSYSNNRFSNGGVYVELGFKEITETFDPSYWYTDFRKRVFRTSCMKIKDLPGTEESQAKAGAFSKHFGHTRSVYKIYDYGHRKWLKID